MNKEVKHTIAFGVALLMAFSAYTQFNLTGYFTNPDAVAEKCLILSTIIVAGMFLVLYLTRDIKKK